MRRELKWATAGIVVIALIALTAVLLVRILDPNLLRNAVAERISMETGREIAIDGDLRIAIGFQPRVTATSVRFANPDWAHKRNMLEIAHLEIAVDLLALARGRWIFPYVMIRNASIDLERNHDGRANWDLDARPDQRQQPLRIMNLLIDDGRLKVIDRPRDIELDATISALGSDEPDASPRVVALVGAGKLKGEDFELTMRGGSLLALLGQDEPYPLEVQIRVGETVAKATGTIKELLNPADTNMSLHIAGPNAALLAPILQVPVPSTRRYELSGDLVREQSAWHFENVSGIVGESDLAGSISLDLAGNRPLIIADLVSENMEAQDLGPLIGLYPEAGGSGPAPLEHILPDAPLQRQQILVTDAQVKFRGKRVVAPRLPLLRDVELDLDLSDGVLRLNPLRFGFTAGEVTLVAAIDSKVDPVHTDLDLKLSAIELQNVLDAAGLEGTAEGTMVGRAVLATDGETLRSAMATARGHASLIMERGHIDGSTLALLDAGFLEALALVLSDGAPEPITINCGAAGFHVENGLMTTTIVVVDTEETLITGEGKFDLGSETLMLRMQGRPKEAGFGHTRVAVVISGPFTAPSAAVDASEVMLRGALALGIGLLAAPIAAIVPFIDLGLGSESNCLKHIEQASEVAH
jgi:uncharacterized protein involved in outer membrane biogenesis